MDCKRALKECEGDMETALDWLRKKGQAIANKKADRDASDGLISAHIDEAGKIGVILELNCETDFVARNEGFLDFLDRLTRQIAAGGPGTSGDIAEFLASKNPENDSMTMQDAVKETIAKLAEKIEIGGFRRIEAGENEHLHSYIHPPGKLGVMLVVKVGKPETRQNPAFVELCNDLTLHIAAAAPEFLTRDEVSSEKLERESAIYREQALEEGKPEKIVDKIVQGKMGKYYSQTCFLEQGFVKDPDESVKKLVERVGKEIGDEIEIVRFERLKVGS